MAIFQVVHKQRLLLQEVRNIYYYETITGNPSASEWQDICDEIRTDFNDHFEPGNSDDWEFYGIDYRQVDVSGLPSFSLTPTSGSVVGSSATDPLATQIALLVSVKENTTAPNHCRTYLCGFTEAHLTDGLFPTPTRSNAENFIDDQSVLNALGTNELQRVSARWNAAHDAVTDYNNVAGAAAVASQVPATQRRRRIGIGI
jgi:hypothetical protein